MRRGRVLKYAWQLCGSYFFQADNHGAWILLSSVIFLNFFLVYVLVKMNYWQAKFYNFLQGREIGLFFEALLFYALLAAVVVAIKGIQVYCRFKLHIGWREWLTNKFVRYWLSDKTYYKLQFSEDAWHDNPDQRMSEDVDLFISLTLRLFLECMQDGMVVLSFIVILWDLSEVLSFYIASYEVNFYGYLVWAALLYAAVGTVVTSRAGSPLVELDYMQQKHEADYRFSLIRVREYAESIAFYHGEQAEKLLCSDVFGDLKRNFADIILMRRLLAWLTSGYSYAAVVYSFFVASPRYFLGTITLGQLFQVVDAFNQVQSGMSFLIDSFTRIAQWKAVVYRLHHFRISLEEVKQKSRRSRLKRRAASGSELVGVERLNVRTPQGKLLTADLSLHLKSGSRLIIMGPSGCGKSTLLRTLAGLWDFGEGEMTGVKEGTMFVPQKPYMPITSLENVLCYPNFSRKFTRQKIQSALSLCRIEHLSRRLGEAGDWGKILSLGEQQRVAFARIFLQKPRVLFLDEATSALDEKNQDMMYVYLTKYLPDSVWVSVAHRENIARFHTLCLRLTGTGAWELIKLGDKDKEIKKTIQTRKIE